MNDINLYRRDTSLDAVGGLLIMYMMLTHLYGHYEVPKGVFYLGVSQLLTFFMAWFFFKAGMFYKQERPKDVFIKKFNRLLVPFVIYSIIGYVVYVVRVLIENSIGGGMS